MSAMKTSFTRLALAAGLGAAVAAGGVVAASAEEPKRGGVLRIVVGSKIPSYDGHRESTFGMIHPIRPFYSLLIRVNPDDPQSSDFICDLCEGDVPAPTNDGRTYTFKLRQGVEFHDGTPLTAHDVVATYNKIIFPPEGILSNRVSRFSMVDAISAPDDHTVQFDLKYASPGFLPMVATPFNFVYAKKDIEREDPEGKDPQYGMKWHQNNINGTGAFSFVEHQPGSHVLGKRYEKYHHEGKPYLDGYKAISAPKMSVRIQAIRGGRADIEFRGFPPKSRDDLVKALGDGINVQESAWNCTFGYAGNQTKPLFQDKRVRQAMTLALDRWGASNYLSKIAIVKTVGGLALPGHPVATPEDVLKTYYGYWPDIKKSREKARELLKAAGAEGAHFKIWNRAVDQPYKVVGTWMLDQWKQVGLDVEQVVVPTGPWYAGLRDPNAFDVAIWPSCQSIVNPIVDAGAWLSKDRAADNRGYYTDKVLDEWYDEMNREGDPDKQKEIYRKFEKRVLHDEAHFGQVLWWHKINPHRSFVKGWKIAPSHYLNQSLDQVWLDLPDEERKQRTMDELGG